MDIIKSIEHEHLKEKVPVLDVGNTVRVHAKIKEGNRERIQVFEGIIIKKQGGGVNETFTVRKISYGVGVEKTFLLHSPMIEKIEVVRVGKARRAKLYYLRDRVGKSARTKEKVGARIETKEIVLKENLVEEEPAKEAEVTEAPVENVEEKVEEVANVQEAAPVKEEKAEEVANNDTAAPSEAKEEAPAVETETPVVQETVDTVTESDTAVDVKDEK